MAQKSPHHHGKMTALPVLDEEIDFLQSIMDKQQVLEEEQAVTSSKQAPPLQTDVPRQRAGQSAPPPRPTTTSPPNPPATKLSTGAEGQRGPIAVPYPSTDGLLVIMISLCIVLGTAAMILAAVCLVRFQRESRLAQKVDYKAFNGKPPGTANGTSAEDKTLAQNAQMYHYQHQKQQMISMGKQKPEQEIPDSEVTTEDEEAGEDFTVYECPGLAPTGEMEVKNPLFDDSTLQYQRNHN